MVWVAQEAEIGYPKPTAQEFLSIPLYRNIRKTLKHSKVEAEETRPTLVKDLPTHAMGHGIINRISGSDFNPRRGFAEAAAPPITALRFATIASCCRYSLRERSARRFRLTNAA